MCFAWISEQTAIISPYSANLSVFITEAESVYCAVRNGSLNQADTVSYLKGYCGYKPVVVKLQNDTLLLLMNYQACSERVCVRDVQLFLTEGHPDDSDLAKCKEGF